MSEDEGEGGDGRCPPDLGGPAKIRRGGGDGGTSGEGGAAPPFSGQVLENVLEDVLKFLFSRQDRNSASLVCRSWYRAESRTRREVFVGNCYAVAPARAVERFSGVESLILKGKPRIADFNLFPRYWGDHHYRWIIAAPLRLQKLCLKRISVSDTDLDLALISLPFLTDLSVIRCDGFTTNGLFSVALDCRYRRDLRVLDVIDCYMDEDGEDVVDWILAFPETLTSLESLSFECVPGPVNFEALESLVARSPALRQLRVNRNVSAGQLHRLIVRAPHLSHLGTGSFRSDDNEEEAENLAAAFVNARSISCLSGFDGVSPELLPTIYPVCPNLLSLDFSFAEISTDQLRPVIIRCHNLQKFLVLDSVVKDEGLQLVADTCKDLRELHVYTSDARDDAEVSVTDVGLTAISKGCPRLRSILYGCRRMTNVAMVDMSKNSQDLVVFRLCIIGRHRPDHVTQEPMDEGFGAIVMNCKKLTRLAVSGLLTDKAFWYIGKYGKLLRTLSVTSAGNSDMSMRYVLEGCKKLQKLEITNCPYGDSGLLSGIHHYYNMRFLWMSSCKLTLRGCKEVAQRSPRLVVEVIRETSEDDDGEAVEKDDDGEAVENLYMYRSLAGPRDDAPPFVKIL